MHPETDFKEDYYLYISYVFESIFALDITLNFIKEFTPTQTIIPVSDFQSIVSNYFSGQLIFDLIPIIPLQMIKMKNNRERLFYLIKFMRIFVVMRAYSK
jgi:hypothetical protein